ncbi:GNAT family N-acetyltransferase [Arthrobacter sp. 35W]|uniref:GNAT family N-acetyltransferase n=1 Tax=Arthrobacter sp. 35W TaxID=1132441 RepID=UPI0003FD7415|nr:GNAT family N-acetyltransferase [Arthrobacter sp. 35W]
MDGTGVVLIDLESLPQPALAAELVRIATLGLAPGQDEYVGDAAAMTAMGLQTPGRHPFSIVAGGETVGVGTLHAGAAADAGWPDADSAVLLRGFLIDARHQGLGYGTWAARAAVALAQALVRREDLPATGVVLGVNERNRAGIKAYERAGYVDHGRFTGGRSGPQRILFAPFPSGAIPTVNFH